MATDQLKGKFLSNPGERNRLYGRCFDDDLQPLEGHDDTFGGSVQERRGRNQGCAHDVGGPRWHQPSAPDARKEKMR